MHNFFMTARKNIVFEVFIWNLLCVMLLAWPMKTQYYLYLSKRNAFVDSVDFPRTPLLYIYKIRNSFRTRTRLIYTSRIIT
jgi:hypothetical protein